MILFWMQNDKILFTKRTIEWGLWFIVPHKPFGTYYTPLDIQFIFYNNTIYAFIIFFIVNISFIVDYSSVFVCMHFFSLCVCAIEIPQAWIHCAYSYISMKKMQCTSIRGLYSVSRFPTLFPTFWTHCAPFTPIILFYIVFVLYLPLSLSVSLSLFKCAFTCRSLWIFKLCQARQVQPMHLPCLVSLARISVKNKNATTLAHYIHSTSIKACDGREWKSEY